MTHPMITSERCPLVRCRARLDFTTDTLGRTVARCRQCERRRAGICRDCPAPVAGTVGKAYRCAAHQLAKRKADDRANTIRNREEVNARARITSKSPERKARKAAAKRAWAERNREKLKAQRRRYVLKQTPGYVEGYRRANRDPMRMQRKRELAKAAYRRKHGPPPVPHCRICGEAIAYERGRAPVTCGRRGVCVAQAAA